MAKAAQNNPALTQSRFPDSSRCRDLAGLIRRRGFMLASLMSVVFVAPVAAVADGLPFTPGKYETTSMPGNQRNTICIPDKSLNAKSLENMMNKAGDRSQQCRVKQRALKDNLLTVSISCRYPNDLEGKGEMRVRVNGARFTSDTAFALTGNGESRDVSIKTKARRVGDC